VDKSLLIPWRVEGTNWYGRALLENARSVYNQWVEANAGASRYDKKVAGSHFVVRYPVGKSVVNGTTKDNYEVAQDLLRTLESSGSIAIPNVLDRFVEELNQQQFGWSIEILEDKGGRQPTFIDRLRYLDVMKVRALLMPERAVLEGVFGTKAEARTHADLALTNIELMGKHVVRHVNWYCVDQLLALNWGEEARGSVWIVQSPLVDQNLSYLRDVYELILKNPSGFVEEYGKIDTSSLKDLLRIPSTTEEIDVVESPAPAVDQAQLERVNRLMGQNAE